MDIFDRIASEFKKEARIPKGDKGAYKEWKENLEKKNPSAAEDWAKYEGAFDPSTGKMNESRIKENEGKGKKKASYDDEIIDDLGFERFASDDDEIIDDLGFDRFASDDDEIIDDLGFDRYASEDDDFFFKTRR